MISKKIRLELMIGLVTSISLLGSLSSPPAVALDFNQAIQNAHQELDKKNYQQAKAWLKEAKTYRHPGATIAQENLQQAVVNAYYSMVDSRQQRLCEAVGFLDNAEAFLKKSESPMEPEPVWLQRARWDYEQAKIALKVIDSETIGCVLANRAIGVQAKPKLNVRIQFDLDSSQLTDQGHQQVVQLAKALREERWKNYAIHLAGHTDIRGSEDYNQRLSEQRAAAVKQQLVNLAGVLGPRIKSYGMGETRPLWEGDSEEVHAINRRVEVRLEK